MHCGWIVLGTVCSNKPTHDPPKYNLLILCFARFHIDYVRVLNFPSIVFLLIPALFFPSMRCWPVRLLLYFIVLFVSACVKNWHAHRVSQIIVKHFRLT